MENKRMTLTRLFYLLGFIALILCVLIELGPIFSPKTNTRQAGMVQPNARGFFGEKKDTIQVLSIGNSNVYRAVSPLMMYKDYGFTSYVIGEPLQSPIAANQLFHQFLKYQKPRVVVIDTNEFFNRPGSYVLDTLVTKRVNQILPFTQYHTRWKSLNPQDFSRVYLPYHANRDKGFTYKKKRVSFKPEKYKTFTANLGHSITLVDRYYIDDIIKTCEKQNIHVVFMTTWVPKDWNERRSETVQKLANHYHIPYLDFNTPKLIKATNLSSGMDGQKSDFADYGTHFNLYGAQKLSHYLGNYLNSHYKLTDVRKDKAYTSWNKDLEDFEKCIHKKVKKSKHKASPIL